MPKRNPLTDNERMLIILTLNSAGEFLQEAADRGEDDSKLFEDLDTFIKATTVDILQGVDMEAFMPKLTEFYRQYEEFEEANIH